MDRGSIERRLTRFFQNCAEKINQSSQASENSFFIPGGHLSISP